LVKNMGKSVSVGGGNAARGLISPPDSDCKKGSGKIMARVNRKNGTLD